MQSPGVMIKNGNKYRKRAYRSVRSNGALLSVFMLHACVCGERTRMTAGGGGDPCNFHKRKCTPDTQQVAKGQEEEGEGRFKHACVHTPAPEQD